MKASLKLFALILLAGWLLSGCAAADNTAQRWATISGSEIDKTVSGEELFFHVPVEQDMLDNQTSIIIQTDGQVHSGALQFVLLDPEDEILWTSGTISTGDFSIKERVHPMQTGLHKLGLVWDGPVTAAYNLSWQGFVFTPAILVPGAGMVLVAAAFVVYSLRRGSGWRYMVLGALAWLVTVAVKFTIAIPLNPLVNQALAISSPYTEGQLWSPGNLLYYLYVGAMTGVTEVLLTWLLLRYTRLGQVGWTKALGFGIGFGAFEALLLGLLALPGAVISLLSPWPAAASLPALAQTNNILYGLAPVSERFAVILAHLLCNVLLFYGVVKGQSRWFWASFAFKTLLDSVAGFAQVWGIGTIAKLWTIEAVILVMGLAALWWTLRIRDRYPEPREAAAQPPDSLESQPA